MSRDGDDSPRGHQRALLQRSLETGRRELLGGPAPRACDPAPPGLPLRRLPADTRHPSRLPVLLTTLRVAWLLFQVIRRGLVLLRAMGLPQDSIPRRLAPPPGSRRAAP